MLLRNISPKLLKVTFRFAVEYKGEIEKMNRNICKLYPTMAASKKLAPYRNTSEIQENICKSYL